MWSRYYAVSHYSPLRLSNRKALPAQPKLSLARKALAPVRWRAERISRMPTNVFFEESTKTEPLGRLAQAVILQAMEDASCNGDSEALEFLLDPDNPYSEIANIEPNLIRRYVISGLQPFRIYARDNFHAKIIKTSKKRNDGNILLLLYDFLHELRTAEIG
jgi:hypothetical protein